MESNCLMFSWKKSVPGRERIGAAHFAEFVDYLAEQQKNGLIGSFEPVLLSPTGEGPTGFFFVRGNGRSLAQMTATREWKTHIMRGLMHLENPCLTYGTCGKNVMEQMKVWSSLIPD